MRDKKSIWSLKPSEIPAVDPDHFGFAIQVASAAHALKMPMKSPATEGGSIRFPDGREIQFNFTDIPANRALMAMRDHFGPDTNSFVAAAMRFFALHRLWPHERMKKWVKPSPEEPDVVLMHDAVFQAAATLPLDDNGEFAEKAFFDRVEELAAEDER